MQFTITHTSTFRRGGAPFDDAFPVDTGLDYVGDIGATVCERDQGNAAWALEAWLFFRAELKTLSAVFVSDHAYQDARLRERAAKNGTLVLRAEKEATATLEIGFVRYEIRLVDIRYAQDCDPPGHYIDQATFELKVSLINPFLPT
jgi:hypothetical protein